MLRLIAKKRNGAEIWFEDISELTISRDSISFTRLSKPVIMSSGNGGFVYLDEVYHDINIEQM